MIDDFDRLPVCGARWSTCVQTNQFAATAGGWQPSDTANAPQKMMHAKCFCVVVSSIDVRGLGVWVRCGAGACG